MEVKPSHAYPKDASTLKRRKDEEREAKLLMFARAFKKCHPGRFTTKVKLPRRVRELLKSEKKENAAA